MRLLYYTLFSSLFWLGKILISTKLLPHRSGYIEFEIAGKRVTRCIQKKLHAILLQSGENGRFSHNIYRIVVGGTCEPQINKPQPCAVQLRDLILVAICSFSG